MCVSSLDTFYFLSVSQHFCAFGTTNSHVNIGNKPLLRKSTCWRKTCSFYPSGMLRHCDWTLSLFVHLDSLYFHFVNCNP